MKPCTYGDYHSFIETEYQIQDDRRFTHKEVAYWCRDCGYYRVVEQRIYDGEVESEKVVVDMRPNVTRGEHYEG